MRFDSSLLTICLLTGILGGTQPAWSQIQSAQEVVLVPLQGFTVSEDTRFSLEQHLREEVNRITGFNVQRRSETIAHIEGMRSMEVYCKWDDTSCLTQLGTLSGATKVVVGTVVQTEDAYSLSAVMLDVATETREREINVRVGLHRDAWPLGMRLVATQLLVPEEVVGSLRVSVNEPNAKILVDGAEMGVSPLEGEVQGLLPGRHHVDVTLDGYEPYSGFAEIAFGETVHLEVELLAVGQAAQKKAEATSPTSDDAMGLGSWTMLGSAGGIAAIGGMSLGMAAMTYGVAAVRARTELGPDETATGRYQEGMLWSGAVWTMGAVGAAGLATGAVMAAAAPLVE